MATTRIGLLDATFAVLVGTVVAATAQQALVALGAIAIGDEPGAGAAGDLLVGAAVAALVVGSVLTLLTSGSARVRRLGGLLAVAGAVLAVARFLSYDPYFAPSLRRFGDGGPVSPAWLLAVAAAAGAALLLARRGGRGGALAVAASLLLAAATVLYEATGH